MWFKTPRQSASTSKLCVSNLLSLHGRTRRMKCKERRLRPVETGVSLCYSLIIFAMISASGKDGHAAALDVRDLSRMEVNLGQEVTMACPRGQHVHLLQSGQSTDMGIPSQAPTSYSLHITSFSESSVGVYYCSKTTADGTLITNQGVNMTLSGTSLSRNDKHQIYVITGLLAFSGLMILLITIISWAEHKFLRGKARSQRSKFKLESSDVACSPQGRIPSESLDVACSPQGRIPSSPFGTPTSDICHSRGTAATYLDRESLSESTNNVFATSITSESNVMEPQPNTPTQQETRLTVPGEATIASSLSYAVGHVQEEKTKKLKAGKKPKLYYSSKQVVDPVDGSPLRSETPLRLGSDDSRTEHRGAHGRTPKGPSATLNTTAHPSPAHYGCTTLAKPRKGPAPKPPAKPMKTQA